LTGIASIMFGSLAIVVIFSLSVSLFVAVTLVPVLCSRLLRVPQPNRHPGAIGRFVAASGRVLDALDDAYRRLLHRALAHRAVVVVVAGALFVASLAALPLVGFELAPAADEGQVRVTAELPVGTRIERSAEALQQIEQLIEQSVPEAQSVMAQTGSLSSFGPGGGTADQLNVTIDLGSRDGRSRSSEEVTRALRRDLVGIPGVIARARAAGDQFNINRAIGGGQNQISVEIRGHDLADQARLANEVRTLMEATPGVIDVTLEAERGRPEIGITTDVRRAALWGLSVTDVANALRTSVGGTQAAFYRERGEEYPIVVRMQERDRLSLAQVGELLVYAGEGQLLPVKDLIEVTPQTGPVEIRRRDQERVTRVTAEVETVVSEAIQLVGAQLANLDVPADFSVGFGQEVEEQNETFLQILLVLLLAVVLVYAVMASQFESFKDPFIIMFSIPLAVIGVVGALLVTGTPFSLPAGIGVVLLAGLVVNNAILLVDYTNTLRRRDGLPLFDAIEIAGRTRLRPILMTSVTTILGLVPMALGFGEGSEMQAPLARVVIGGLATSTLITLIVVPTVYSLFEGGWRRGTVDEGSVSPAA
jgi:HAE1 family hydrophobic/amphiphilic exporter-1